MAKPTHHSALESLGFRLAGESFNGSSDRIGVATTRHYVLHTNSPGGKLARPITHHVYVDEFGKKPGKYNLSYHVTQDGQQYADGDYDTLRRHRDNFPSGSADPVADIMVHHRGVLGSLSRGEPSSFTMVTPANGGRLIPTLDQARMVHLNSAPEPLDLEVHRKLTSESGSGPRFSYLGRFPGDDGTDVYSVTHKDPESPHTFRYSFTVRHRPDSTHPFSYSATRHQAGVDENGEEDIGSFLDVTGDMDLVINFGTTNQLITRHKDLLSALGMTFRGNRKKATGPVSDDDWESFVAGRNPVHGMMSDGTPVVDHFDPNFGPLGEPDSRGARSRNYLDHAVQRGPSGEPEVYEFRGRCVTCGTPTWNTRDGGEAPEWQHTGNAHYAEEYGMHGPDIPQCADCANDHDRYENAIRQGQMPGGKWHYPGARINDCDHCYNDLMSGADDELR